MSRVEATPELVGRGQERARVERFSAEVPNGARALLVTGAPGIGKTALWRHGVGVCERGGFVVRVTRAAEEEMQLGLAGIVDLVGDEPGVTADNLFSRGQAVLAALRRLAASGPVLLAIDDLQWLDSGSGRALRFALRRLDAEPVGLLATLREGGDPLSMTATLPPGRTEWLELGPLGVAELRRLLGRARAVEAISAPMLQRIYETSGGNPLYALELARALDRAPGQPRDLPLPSSLRAAIAERLEHASELDLLLRTISALGPTSVTALRRAMPDAGIETQLDAAQARGLLVVDDDLVVRFAHPLIATVVYDRMPAFTRRSLHARLAAATADPDVRARHLALSTDDPDAEVAALLEDAAGRARDREAFDRAAEFAGHSVRLTPSRDRTHRLRRALTEIDDLAIAGELKRALGLADRLVADCAPGPERCEALLERAYIDDDDIVAGVERLRGALSEAGGDVLLRARMLGHIGWVLGMFAGDLPAGLEAARAWRATADPDLDPGHWMSSAAQLAYLQMLGGQPDESLMAEAVAWEARSGKPILWTSPRTLQAETWFWDGALGAARTQFQAVRDDAARTGTRTHHPYSMFDLALVDIVAGELTNAEALVDDGIEAARDAEDTWAERLLLYPRALVDAWRGRVDAARLAAHQRIEEAERKRERPGVVRGRTVLGFLALSEGDDEAAALELGEAARELDAMGFRHPGAFPVLPDAIEALARSGDEDAARVLLERLERDAAAVQSPWAQAAAERAGGTLELAQGRAEDAALRLAGAADAFDALGCAPDAARAVLMRGRALLRAGRRAGAADALLDARRRFAEIGAPLWECRAAEELDRAEPGRARGLLTPTERRIAALVTAGKRNGEIARTLFVSVATVEAHLTRTYRKLGIRSRSELARRVADGSLGEV